MKMERRVCAALLVLALSAWTLPSQAGEAVKYLPNDAEAVISLNVKQLANAPVVEAFLGKAKDKLAVITELQKAQQDIGLDPLRDIERVTFAMGADPRQVLILVQGKFDVQKIQATAPQIAKDKKDIFKIVQEGIYTFYEVRAPEERQPVFVAVLDEGNVVVSPSKGYITDALDKKAGTKSGSLKKELQQLITKADDKQSITISAMAAPLAATGQPLVAKITTIAGAINVTEDLKLELVLSSRDAKDAKDVATELNENLDQVKALVENAAQVDARLKGVLEAVGTLKVAADGSAVTLKGQVSKDVINSLNKLLGK